MKTIESTGKNLDEAIKNGLDSLGVTLDEVDVDILEGGGFFKKAKVRLTVIEEDELSLESLRDVIKPADRKENEAKQAEREEKAKKEEKEKKEAEEKSDVEKAEKTEKVEKKADKKKEPAFVKKPHVEEKRDYPPATAEQVEKAKAYTEGLLKAMGIEGSVNATVDVNVITLDIVTDSAQVIGHRGETLDAIQTLAKRAAESEDDQYLRVVADSQGYRGRREQALIALAHRMADKAVKKGRKVALEPMESAQRKIIHAALGDDERVYTKSDGHEPSRRVIIFPIRNK